MALALLMTLALLLGTGCALLSWAHVRRIATATSRDARALALALERVPAADRLDELGRRTDAHTWERRLADDVRAAPSLAAKIAAVNDALADVEHTLRAGAAWPAGAIRIALFGAMLLAVAAWLLAADLPAALAIAAIGLVSAALSFEAKLRAERRAASQRSAIDRLVAVAVGRLVTDAGEPPPERRSRRRTAR